ncbi:MAG: hypothetical protein Mars2KO_44370 [Maribacter sp.]
MEKEKKIQDLIHENESLKSQLNLIEEARQKRKKRYAWVAKKTAKTILGNDLKTSISNSLSELKERKYISKETSADLIANIIYRLTRIGIFGLIIAILPTIFLIIQTIYLGKQNQKIDKQNELINNQNSRLQQQTYLQEADRRSSLVFLSGSIMDLMDQELKDTTNENRELSDQLIGRIVSLSRSFKPYRYLENDSLTKIVSPERGQLLINLTNSNLDSVTYRKIFDDADFSYTELSDIVLEDINFYSISMPFSTLKNVEFKACKFEYPNFNYSHLDDISFTDFTMAKQLNFQESFINSLSLNNTLVDYLNLDLSFISSLILVENAVIRFSAYESFINNLNIESNIFGSFLYRLNDGNLKDYFSLYNDVYEKLWSDYYLRNEKTGLIFKQNLTDNLFYKMRLSENIFDKFEGAKLSKFDSLQIVNHSSKKDIVNYLELEKFETVRDSTEILIVNKASIDSLVKHNLNEKIIEIENGYSSDGYEYSQIESLQQTLAYYYVANKLRPNPKFLKENYHGKFLYFKDYIQKQ